MHLLKRAALSLVLLILALVALNLMRFSFAPPQARSQGAEPVAIRNGDVDCDGQINITDPLVILNWLFANGPEPCAIAQTDTCCESLHAEIASIRATVASLAARIPSPQDLITVTESPLVFTSAATRVFVEVPEGKRFVLTSLSIQNNGARIVPVALLNGTPIEIVGGLDVKVQGLRTWTSGLALPLGADLAVQTSGPSNGGFFVSGYLVAE